MKSFTFQTTFSLSISHSFHSPASLYQTCIINMVSFQPQCVLCPLSSPSLQRPFSLPLYPFTSVKPS
ncbi:hypothetical protein VNO78_15056 [Psophocarpus tetragonolobus]|uniref:Uncharacterized protein n=1 Tax=Psophocarpus tetragonolobus TaxID=3891 RepID=A0AAN9XIU9_PSOTE